MANGKNFLVGVYNDDDVLIHAVDKVRASGVKIKEVYTPFPVHGLDTALGYAPSNLPVVAFLCGMTGTICALSLTIGTMTLDWPMDIGGKPFFALPNFIPVTFELTVLLASLGMVFSFFCVANLAPWVNPTMYDARSVDDKFVMVIDLERNNMTRDQITKILSDSGAEEVNAKILE